MSKMSYRTPPSPVTLATQAPQPKPQDPGAVSPTAQQQLTSPPSATAAFPAPPAAPMSATARFFQRLFEDEFAALVFYFFSSVALTVFNKWFFGPHCALSFRFPLTVTSTHQLLAWVMLLATESRVHHFMGGPVVHRREYLLPIGALGIVSGLDWGLSNTSLKYIPLSLYEMVKSMSPVIVVLITIAAGLMKGTRRVFAIVFLITAGIVLAVSGGDFSVFSSAAFPMGGFICVDIATALSGVRATLTQHIMQRFRCRDGRSVAPLSVLYYSAPLCSAVLVLPAMYWEGAAVSAYLVQRPVWDLVQVAAIISATVVLAYCLTLAEFIALRRASALTMCVVGVLKQLCLIFVAMAFFREHVGALNIAGFMAAVGGVALYNHAKYTGALGGGAAGVGNGARDDDALEEKTQMVAVVSSDAPSMALQPSVSGEQRPMT